MSDAISGINQANSYSGSDMAGMYAQSMVIKASVANPTKANDAAEVRLSTTVQLQSLNSTGAGVGELSAEFNMPESQVQDDLGMYPVSARSTVKPAPIADPSHPSPSVAKPDVSVQLSTPAQIQSMREAGSNAEQIAAALGMTVSEVAAQLDGSGSALQAATGISV